MKIMAKADLIKVESSEWNNVKEYLLKKGYILYRPPQAGGHKELWTHNLKTCVSQFCKETGCYWLDIRVLPHLEIGDSK